MNVYHKDIVVVGGGLTGIAAGLTAANRGFEVVVLEKTDSPGNVNVDELAYPHALKKILSDFNTFEDFLTPITRRAFWLVTPDSHTAIECVTPVDNTGVSGFVVDRRALDNVLISRFEKLGGEYRTNLQINSVMKDDDKVIGVQHAIDSDEYFAPVTIFADGCDSNLSGSLISRGKVEPTQSVLIVKETLTSEGITPCERLTGDNDKAASIILLGDPLGIGFSWARMIAYKNKLVLKIYVPLDLVSEKQENKTFIERLKMHPSVETYVKNMQSESIVTQTIKVDGFVDYPDQLWDEGYIVAGKAAGLYHPFDCRMTDYSIMSGVIAGNASLNAKIDRRPTMPGDYPRMLSENFIIPDRNSMRNIMLEMRNNRKFSVEYPQVFLGFVKGIFTMDERLKTAKKTDLERELRLKTSQWDMASDFMNVIKMYG